MDKRQRKSDKGWSDKKQWKTLQHLKTKQKKTLCRYAGAVAEHPKYILYDVKQVPKITNKCYLIVLNKDRKEPCKQGHTYLSQIFDIFFSKKLW
jgi:hypothetical protein